MSRYQDAEYVKNYRLDSYRRMLRKLYVGLLCIMLILVGINTAFRDTKVTDIGFGTHEDITGDWRTLRGKTFHFDRMDKYLKKEGDTVSAFYLIPKDQTQTCTISFRSKNMYVKALMGEDVIYETDVVEAPFNMNSPGTRWNFITIPPNSPGKCVELQMRGAYHDGKEKLDTFMIGDRAEIVITLIKQKLLALLISVLIIIVGLFYIIVDLLSVGVKKRQLNAKPHSLFYLGILSVMVAFWGILETNIPQLFVADTSVLQMIDNMMLLAGSMSLYMYLDCEYDILKNTWLRIPVIFQMILIVIGIAFHMTGFMDFHQTTRYTNYCSVVVLVVVVICIVKQGTYYRNSNEQIRFYYQMQKFGVIALGLGLSIDLICYATIDALDRAACSRVGLLVFVVSFGMGNIHHLLALARQGETAAVMRDLAYSDSLTGVENRNSYDQRVEELLEKKTKKTLAVIMCDVNNLKQMNDIEGHHVGDQLIQASAEIICDSFGVYGTVYRVGGDEFRVLIEDNNASECYRQGRRAFHEKMRHYNQHYPFKISIAHGVAYCVNITKEGIERAEQEADQAMYENKRYIKIKEHREMR